MPCNPVHYHLDDEPHADVTVYAQVAVHEPKPRVVCEKTHNSKAARGHHNCVLEGRIHEVASDLAALVHCNDSISGCNKTYPSMVLIEKYNEYHLKGLYRDRLKSMLILLSRTQAGPGRAGKQEQEQISPNHLQAFWLISVYFVQQKLR